MCLYPLISQLTLSELAPSRKRWLLQFHRAGPSTAPDKEMSDFAKLRKKYTLWASVVKVRLTHFAAATKKRPIAPLVGYSQASGGSCMPMAW
jgi:hypothetical protein